MINPNARSKVESLIDSIVKGNKTPTEALNELNVGKGDTNTIEFTEGEESCPTCGNRTLERGYIESESGNIPALRCKCGTILESMDGPDSDAPQIMEAEIDEDNPVCPRCGSDNLSDEMVESEGEDNVVIHCGDCELTMLVAD